MFLPFLQTMIEQLETRLLRSQPHFRATNLLPSNMDFSLSDQQIAAKLQPIFAQDSMMILLSLEISRDAKSNKNTGLRYGEKQIPTKGPNELLIV